MAEDSQRLQSLLVRINEIATLPHIIMQVMQVSNDPKSDVSDLREVIESDPALSARVFKCINSSAYGLKAEITDLQHAIAYLGFRQVCNLALGATVCEIFDEADPVGPYHRLGLWRHLVSVAAVSRLASKQLSVGNPEEIFLAGLLHDLGIILADQYDHDHFIGLMQHLPSGRPLIEIEEEYLGYTHTALGYESGKLWKLPEVVCQAMLHHHAAENSETAAKEVACVELANVLCSLKGITSVGVKLVDLRKPAMEVLGLGADTLKALTTEIDRELGLHEDLVALPAQD